MEKEDKMSSKTSTYFHHLLSTLEPILKSAQDPSDKLYQNAKQNQDNAFNQMCYYQSYSEKSDNTGFMQQEYKKWKTIYLCYSEPKLVLHAFNKGLITKKIQKAIISHFLNSGSTLAFRKKGSINNPYRFFQKNENSH